MSTPSPFGEPQASEKAELPMAGEEPRPAGQQASSVGESNPIREAIGEAIEQHRLVYEVFGAEIGGPIHALSLQTKTPEQASIH